MFHQQVPPPGPDRRLAKIVDVEDFAFLSECSPHQ